MERNYLNYDKRVNTLFGQRNSFQNAFKESPERDFQFEQGNDPSFFNRPEDEIPRESSLIQSRNKDLRNYGKRMETNLPSPGNDEEMEQDLPSRDESSNKRMEMVAMKQQAQPIEDGGKNDLFFFAHPKYSLPLNIYLSFISTVEALEFDLKQNWIFIE